MPIERYINTDYSGTGTAVIPFQTDVTGDANFRFTTSAGGALSWGPGNTASDVTLSRSSTGVLNLAGSLSFTGSARWQQPAESTMVTALNVQPFTANKAPFGLVQSSTLFNGTQDQVAFLGFNPAAPCPGGNGGMAGQQSWHLGFENNYNDGSRMATEFYLQYVSTDRSSSFRPLMIDADMTAPGNQAAWGFIDLGKGPKSSGWNQSFSIVAGNNAVAQWTPGTPGNNQSVVWDQFVVQGNTGHDAWLQLATSNGAHILWSDPAGWQWQIYVIAGDEQLYLHDYASNHMHAVFSHGSTDQAALTTLHSGVNITGPLTAPNLALTAASAAVVPLTLTGAAGQTADTLQIKNSTGTVVAGHDAVGRLYLGATASFGGGTGPMMFLGNDTVDPGATPPSGGSVLFSNSTTALGVKAPADSRLWMKQGATGDSAIWLGGAGFNGDGIINLFRGGGQNEYMRLVSAGGGSTGQNNVYLIDRAFPNAAGRDLLFRYSEGGTIWTNQFRLTTPDTGGGGAAIFYAPPAGADIISVQNAAGTAAVMGVNNTGTIYTVQPSPGSASYSSIVSGSAQPHLAISANGTMNWGPGSAASDTFLQRGGSGGVQAQVFTASIVPFTVLGAAGQSADLFDIKNSSGTVLTGHDATGRLYLGSSPSFGGGVGPMLFLQNDTTDPVGSPTGGTILYANGSYGLTLRAASGAARLRIVRSTNGDDAAIALGADGLNGDSILHLYRGSGTNEEMRLVAAAGGSTGQNNVYLIDRLASSAPVARSLMFRTSIDGGTTWVNQMQIAAQGYGAGSVIMYAPAAGDILRFMDSAGATLLTGVNSTGGIYTGQSAVSNGVLTSYVTGGANPMYSLNANGTMGWGPGGASGQDVSLSRYWAGALAITASGSNSPSLFINGGSGQGCMLQFVMNGASTWLLYQNTGSTPFFIRDTVNARMHIVLTPGTSNATAVTEIASTLQVDGSLTAPSVSVNGASGVASFLYINGTNAPAALSFMQNTSATWQFYQNPGDPNFYFRDLVNARMQMTLTPGASASTALAQTLSYASVGTPGISNSGYALQIGTLNNSDSGLIITGTSGMTGYLFRTIGSGGNTYNLITATGQMYFVQPTITNDILYAQTPGANYNAFTIRANGSHLWGASTTPADVSLVRNGIGSLQLAAIGANSAALYIGNAAAGTLDSIVNLLPPTGRSSVLIWGEGSTNYWQFYKLGGDSSLYFRDLVNAKMQMYFTPGATAAAATTNLVSTLNVVGGTATLGDGTSANISMLILNAAATYQSIIQWKQQSTLQWQIGQNAGGGSWYVYDAINGTFRVTLTTGATVTAALADFNSSVQIRGNVGLFGQAPAAKPTVTGSRGGNAALASLLTGLASLGLLTDSSTA